MLLFLFNISLFSISYFILLILFILLLIYFINNFFFKKNNKESFKKPINADYIKYIEDISHEIKTPLFSIQGYIETLLEGGAINDANVREPYLKNIYKASDRLMNLIKDLDSIHELEKDKLHLFYNSFDLLDIINDTIDLLKQKAIEKNVIIRKPNTNKPIIVYADQNRISQVFLNLISNAIFYCTQENIITIEINETANEWNIEINDTGIGISKKDLKHIFDRFYRVEKSRNSNLGGSGLGLSIVDKILKSHNKKIAVKSNLGYGTTFSFSLDKS